MIKTAMKQFNFKNLALALTLFLLTFGAISLVATVPVHALADHIQVVADTTQGHDAACNGLSQLNGNGCGSGQSDLTKVLSGVVTIISYIAGIIAIIMVIISGIRYTTSGGESASVSGAKSALIYALIGVAVAALAQILVHFVLNTTSGVS